jgi:hypothetical protein
MPHPIGSASSAPHTAAPAKSASAGKSNPAASGGKAAEGHWLKASEHGRLKTAADAHHASPSMMAGARFGLPTGC